MEPLKKIQPDDLQWLSEQEEHWAFMRVQNVKNLDQIFKTRGEAIVKKYIDPKFVLDRSCTACNYKMVEMLLKLWEDNMPTATLEDGAIVVEAPQADNKKPEKK